MTKETVIAEFEQSLNDAKRALDMLQGVLLGQGFIVVAAGGFALNFTIENHIATAPRPIKTSMAPRFSKLDAIHLAASVKDGRGDRAKAVHIKDALAADIANLEGIILSMREAA